MSYNIEEHEDHLKNKMPFEINEVQWQSMQQRIRERVLAENIVELSSKKRKFNYKAAIGVAAGIALFITLLLPRSHKTETNSPFSVYENAEQHLDKTINGLNEEELDWMHQLNENEISEQEEYIENQVAL